MNRFESVIGITAVAALLMLLSSPASAAFPGLNGQIVFVRYPDIFVMNADGSAQTQLTGGYSPAWSPDGTQIAFWRVDAHNLGDILVMNADGSGQTNITDSPASGDYSPAWSPGGNKIAFSGARGGNWDIYVVYADGTGEVRLTDHPTTDSAPAWSPDGSKIAFSSQRDDYSGEIYVMNSDGSGVTRLTNSPNLDASPDWSPDGTKIAFTSWRNTQGDPGEVFVMNADGSNQADVVGGSSPAWSPDGTKLVVSGISVMNADGTGLTPLGSGSDPDWQPLVDTDSDGVFNPSDNCPNVPNTGGQADDVDGDLAGDACDAPGTGNVDCSGPAMGVSSVDALKVLRHSAALPVSQNEPCLDIGQPRQLAPPDDWKMGDVNCSGGATPVNAVDALLILRANASLPVNIPGGCPEIKPP